MGGRVFPVILQQDAPVHAYAVRRGDRDPRPGRRPAPRRLGIAETAAGLAGLLRKSDVLAAEADEVRAARRWPARSPR